MASLYRQPKSVFWWVKYRDKDGRRRRESTRLNANIPSETYKAKVIEADLTRAEFAEPKHAQGQAGRWDIWVAPYLDARYQASPITHLRNIRTWANLRRFLDEKGIEQPSNVRREHGFAFLDWRQSPQPEMRKAKRNTALLEMKLFSFLMKEAIRRGLCTSNPMADLGIKRVASREKPELTDEHLALIEEAILLEPEPRRTMLHNSFLIARWQGCRLNETWLDPMTAVELSGEGPSRRGLIHFRIKGGRQHTAPMAPQLMPLFDKLRAAGARETYARTMNGSVPWTSRDWHSFLWRSGLKLKIPGVTPHCLRVTAATRMARGGVSISKAMKFLGHTSESIHRIYQKLRADDLDDCFAALGPSPHPPQSPPASADHPLQPTAS